MKIKYILYLSLFILGGYSCQDEIAESAQEYLARARIYYKNAQYELALQSIDSIRLVTPKAYNQIRWGELLSDSIVRKINEVKVDSLESTINGYKRQIYLQKENIGNNVSISVLEQNIDSVQRLKVIPKSIVDEIARKEAVRMAKCQCQTIMRQR